MSSAQPRDTFNHARNDQANSTHIVFDTTPNTRPEGIRVAPLEQARPNEGEGVDEVGIWLLAAQHFSSTWGDRSAEFAFPIYLIEIFVDTLLPASVYGFVTTAAGIFLSGAIGSQIDMRPRLPAIRTCIMTQKLFASACYSLFLFLFSKFISLSSDARRLFLVAIIICGCGLKLATVGMNICVERDWVMTITAGSQSNVNTPSTNPTPQSTQSSQAELVDRTLLRLNMILRRIDLICKLTAPLFVSLLTSTVGYKLSAVVLLGISVVTAAFEGVFVGVVYGKFPVLAAPRLREDEGREPERANERARGWLNGGREWVEQQAKDWNEFARHPIFLSSISISLLYFNVLSFNSPFISYLKSQTDFSDPLIAGMRGLCVVTGLFGTFLMPWMEKRIGIIRTGSWAIWSEALSLVPTVLCLYVGVGERQRPKWNSALLFTGMAISRIGLWSFDLVQLTQLQKALAHHPRQNTLSALQYSLQNVFDLAHYGLTLGWNRPADFKYAAAVSMGAVFVAAALYVIGYARPLRGHLFHFDTLRSKLGIWARRG
ncbi:hypothetical protein BDV93DRAFT_494555 [Ceratobasidium sp. AG-I]|nr:hypothetical protein BDV93DRAFT_494555 [Ceratobasidium sp. AG-I]